MSKVILKTNDFEIQLGNSYKIVHKKDPSAPSGMVNMGATKLPSEGIGNTINCAWKKGLTANSKGSYDTGLFEQSPCFRDMQDKKQVKAIVSLLQTHIVEPYESIHGEGILDSTHLEHWDTMGIDLFEGRVFNTNRVEDLLDMYIAMQSKHLCPIGLQKSPKYKKAQYCIVDLDKAVSTENQQVGDIMNAIGDFKAIYTESPVGAENILRYVGCLPLTHKLDETSLNGLFYMWVNKDVQNVDKFNKAVAEYRAPKTKDMFNIYVKVCELYAKQSKLVKEPSGIFYFDGIELGHDLRVIARDLVTNKDMKEAKVQISQAE